MTSFRIDRFDLTPTELQRQAQLDERFANWPVVYILNGPGDAYVGESLNALSRLGTHATSPDKQSLHGARVVMDDTFNKSVCLDLESFLIRLLAGDGRFRVLNRNEGITNANYYGREGYQATFQAIFDQLLAGGLFDSDRREIENSDLFKLSPFKALTTDQLAAVEDIVEALFHDLASNAASRLVVQGDPGTGKTVVGIFLMKLLSDIQHFDPDAPMDSDSVLAEFFLPSHAELLAKYRVALIVPQQSLRKSIRRVFKRTAGLTEAQVLSPFELGKSPNYFDLLIVDEAHRLNRRASQASGMQNLAFQEINEALFTHDDPSLTQLDWIVAKSRHQILLIDGAQAVRPADLATESTQALVDTARNEGRRFRLTSQMRVKAGEDYVGYVRSVLAGGQPERTEFEQYDLRMFDDLEAMREAILAREREVGLARMVAGYAWPWRSRRDKNAYDIVESGITMKWNSTDVDWVSTPRSIHEVGSIHTVQGYDLNYAGVIIGRDLRFDPVQQRLYFDRSHYFDKKGMQNIPRLGLAFSDDEIFQFVKNIYAVLMTRGIEGTYLYVCDEPLREYLRRWFG